MSPRDKEKKSVFAGKTPLRSRPHAEDAAKSKKAPGKGSEQAKAARKPARPLAEMNQRLAKEVLKHGPKRGLRERVAGLFPLFGVIGIREIGLAVCVASAITMIWIWSYLRVWGFIGVGLGLVIMRYGENWLKPGGTR